MLLFQSNVAIHCTLAITNVGGGILERPKLRKYCYELAIPITMIQKTSRDDNFLEDFCPELAFRKAVHL